MKTIFVLCDPNRLALNLMSSLQQLFPECEIKIVFTEKEMRNEKWRARDASCGS
jgi:hypothetical protein